MIHVAILIKPYLDLIVRGQKSIESRLTITNRPPFGMVRRDERIYFKQSSGPFRATAIVDHVLFVDGLTPARVQALKRTYNHGICGADDYWEWKRDANFASLIWLRDVQTVGYGPKVDPQRGIAWLVLDDCRNVYPECLNRTDGEPSAPHLAEFPDHHVGVIRLQLTDANIRNSNVSIRAQRSRFPKWAFGGPTRRQRARRLLTLELDNGPIVQTDIVEGKKIFRARGPWRNWFRTQAAAGGDFLLLFPIGAGHYQVRLMKWTANVRQANRVSRGT